MQLKVFGNFAVNAVKILKYIVSGINFEEINKR